MMRGRDLEPGGGTLGRLARIDAAGRRRELDGVEVAVACDVTNPLCGPQGASAVYGPQKGASPEMVEALDRNLAHFAAIVERDLGVAIKDQPGSGAAGGLGGGTGCVRRGKLEPGVNLIIDAVRLAERLENADLCLTGEGAIDAQSAFGKTAVGVARLARSLHCPVLALAGSIGPGAEAVLEQGIDAYFSICPGPISLDQAISQAGMLLERATEQAVRGVSGRADGNGSRSNLTFAQFRHRGSEFHWRKVAWTSPNLRWRIRPDRLDPPASGICRRPRGPELGIGDDCAILGIDPGADLLVTTDMLMDGRHFRLAEDGPRAVGYKALGVNLSDIAAMAGVPRAAVVAVALPRADATAVAQGSISACANWPSDLASTWSAATPMPGTARW